MGCDIHYEVERRLESGQWKAVDRRGRALFRRCYPLFAVLAGVRNLDNMTPISEPRGWPEDPSEMVRGLRDRWGCDAHSASWITLSDLQAYDLDTEAPDRNGDICSAREQVGGYFERAIGVLTDLGGDGAARIVFWFDN